MKSTTMTVLALALAATTGYAWAQKAPAGTTAAQVRAQLESKGYTGVNDVEFDGGMWQADARDRNGRLVDVHYDAKTRTIYPDTGKTRLKESDVRTKLSAAGYKNVRDIEFDDGMWQADAVDAKGVEVDLLIDPASGKVVGSEAD